jgi:transcriptional regulator with XRE-family HTH domain
MKKSIYSNEQQLFLQVLRKARQAAGLTQEEVAKRIRQTQSFVSKYERGERRLDIVETKTICDAIGVSFHIFVEDFMRTIKTQRKSKDS